MQILANERNAAAFVSHDPEPVAQLYAYVHYRLTSAHDGNTDQVSRKLNAGIEGTEGNHRVVAFRFGFLRNLCNQRTSGKAALICALARTKKVALITPKPISVPAEAHLSTACRRRSLSCVG